MMMMMMMMSNLNFSTFTLEESLMAKLSFVLLQHCEAVLTRYLLTDTYLRGYDL